MNEINSNNKVIVLSDLGNCCILKCRCCCKYQVVFNNIIFSMNGSELQCLKDVVDSYLPAWPGISKAGRDFLLKINKIAGVNFAFTVMEWLKLKELLSDAFEMIRFYDTLEFSQN